ncbi:MAG: sigma-70 family RNA polymerase sigma factor [Kiritimatiellae bacterium]|nr:sigma-70 family RNA polymerase sigma factor [Kiritimatiellia bacterium]
MTNQEEFLTLFLKHQAHIKAFICSLVRDHYAAEDVVQEVALVLWRKFEEYDAARPFGAWARGIAVRKIMQSVAKQSGRSVVLSPEAIEAISEAYDAERLDPPAEQEALRTCMQRLPEKARRLLALRYEERLRLREIAGRVQSTLDAVHKALSRLRERLQKCIERQLATGPGSV